MAARRLRSIVIDCEKPAPLARFWAAVLEYRVRPYSEADLQQLRRQGISDPEDDPSVAIEPEDERERAEKPNVWFEKVPEGKVVKNRVHLDVNLRSLDEAPISPLATALRFTPEHIDTFIDAHPPADCRVVLCCHSGVRAWRVGRQLQSRGYANLALATLAGISA